MESVAVSACILDDQFSFHSLAVLIFLYRLDVWFLKPTTSTYDKT